MPLTIPLIFMESSFFIRHKKAPRDQQISAGLSTTKVFSMHKQALAINTQSGATMTSREIAEIVGSRHDKVKQTIERLATDNQHRAAVIQLPPLGDVRNHLGQVVAEYVFSGVQGKRDSIIVVAQLSPEFTARLVDRWQELESGFQLPNFNNPAEAARAWANQVEEKQAAIALVEQQKPAVEFVERYVAADSGSKGFRQVAKLLNANEFEFRAFLSDNKIMYRLGGEWMPHQKHIDAGRFEVKAGLAGDHAFNQAKFTAKGVNWIAGLWGQYQLEVAQ